MSGLAASDRKISEGLEFIRQAEKCLKTSLFKWKADHDGAATEYTKAATCFKNAKAYEEAKECFIKAAESHRHMNSPFFAAKSYEQAGLICKENGELGEAADLLEQAAFMFQEHGTPDTAALTLEKAAKFLEKDSPDRAIHLYSKAVDVSEDAGPSAATAPQPPQSQNPVFGQPQPGQQPAQAFNFSATPTNSSTPFNNSANKNVFSVQSSGAMAGRRYKKAVRKVRK